jgi:signal transduction histidine kinase
VRPALAGRNAAADGDQLQLIAELFHALNQPITALRCSLELSLHRPRAVEQYRDTLQAALDHAEQIARLSTGIRELLQADDPGDDRQVLPLLAYVRETVADFQPVAESRGVELVLRSQSSGHVLLEPHRLRQALFFLLEFVLNAIPSSTALAIEVEDSGEDSVIALTWASWGANFHDASAALGLLAKSGEPSQRLGWAIARRIVQAAGGEVQFGEDQGNWRVQVRLPLAPVPA